MTAMKTHSSTSRVSSASTSVDNYGMYSGLMNNDENKNEKLDKGARGCSGGWEAHEAHMELNGDCPWCGSYDRSKWLS